MSSRFFHIRDATVIELFLSLTQIDPWGEVIVVAQHDEEDSDDDDEDDSEDGHEGCGGDHDDDDDDMDDDWHDDEDEEDEDVVDGGKHRQQQFDEHEDVTGFR